MFAPPPRALHWLGQRSRQQSAREFEQSSQRPEDLQLAKLRALLLVNANTPHRVSELTTVTRTGITYDNLDRQIAYPEDTVAPGGVESRVVTDNITFDALGRQTGFHTQTWSSSSQ